MTKIVCSGENLKQALTKVITCVDPREIRRAITGVFFKWSGENLAVTGTNGIRLLEISIPLEENTGDGSFILKFGSAKALIRTLRKHRNAKLYVFSDGRVRSFTKENSFVFIGTLIPVKYPDYQSLLEAAIDTRIEIGLKNFLEGLKEILPNVDPEDNNRLSIAGHGTFFSITHDVYLHRFNGISVDGARLLVDLNGHFLDRLLRNLPDGMMMISHALDRTYVLFTIGKVRALLTALRSRELNPERYEECKGRSREAGSARVEVDGQFVTKGNARFCVFGGKAEDFARAISG